MEIWKDLTGYIGIYQVSSNGRIKSLPRKIVLREKNKPGYNPERVALNNARRECWTDCPEPERYPLTYDGADFDQWGDCEFGIHD